MTSKPIDNLIWIDLEMTGLDPDNDQIIEVAVAITNHDLSETIAGPSLVIGQSKKLMESMDAWTRRTHGFHGFQIHGSMDP